jgi:hypothetical protein
MLIDQAALEAAQRLRAALPVTRIHRLLDEPDGRAPPKPPATPHAEAQKAYAARMAAVATANLPPAGARVRIASGKYEGRLGVRGRLTGGFRCMVLLGDGTVIQVPRFRVRAA